jgi:hypothetical protein
MGLGGYYQRFIKGFSRIRVLKDCKSIQFFAKEGSEIRMDSQVRREFSTTKGNIDKCTNTEYCRFK